MAQELPHLGMKIDFHLDSGAFSAWRKQETIDVRDYGKFLVQNRGRYDICANLDVIPGRFGEKPSKKQVDEAAKKGWENLEYLRSLGVVPVPIFHQGEPFEWLYRMVDEGYEYIGISPDNGQWVGSKRQWLDKVFDILTNDDGQPIVKTHGYAVTSVELMFRYPWASVDSMTAIAAAGYGNVMIPQFKNGKFDYCSKPITVCVSEKASSKDYNKYVDGLGKYQKEILFNFLEQEGITLEQIKTDYYWRNVINHRFMRRCEFFWRKSVLRNGNRNPQYDSYNLISSKKRYGSYPGKKFLPKLYFAVSDCNTFCVVMNVEKIHRRLFSYYSIREYDFDILGIFLTTGLLEDRAARYYATHTQTQFDKKILEEDLKLEKTEKQNEG